jgi:hypothetical protein
MTVVIKRWILYSVGFLFVLSLVFIKGCTYGRKHKKCPEIVTNTIVVHDTVIHHITNSFPYYVYHLDSVIIKDTVFLNIDTLAVIRDYFAVHSYTRQWQDSLLEVTLLDNISQNKPIDNRFSYKIIRPQTITNNYVDNSVTFTKYLYFGIGMPVYPSKVNDISNINYISLKGLYAFPKGFVDVSWTPYTKTYSLGYGIKLLRFK